MACGEVKSSRTAASPRTAFHDHEVRPLTFEQQW
jgi:hypothetical protein